MNWYDRYKDEKILVNQDGEHNKFWAASWDEKNNQVNVRWGRLGTKGQSQVKRFDDRWSAVNFIDQKFHEKRNKGYKDRYNGKDITQDILDRLNVEAAIVGTQNKCHNFQWVEIKTKANGVEYVAISEERLYDPTCHPGILVDFETRKEINGRNNLQFLFTLEKAYDIPFSSGRFVTEDCIIGSGHPLRKMVDKVEEAIGRNLMA